MTLQIREKLTYNGEVYEMFDEPLRSFLYKYDIERLNRTQTIFSTNCWRGYVGHWAIEDDKLYLVELDCLELPRRNALDALFLGQQKVFAEWFSGSISTTLNEKYMYLEFKIEKGKLIEVEKKENKYIRDFDFDQLLDSLYV